MTKKPRWAEDKFDFYLYWEAGIRTAKGQSWMLVGRQKGGDRETKEILLDEFGDAQKVDLYRQ